MIASVASTNRPRLKLAGGRISQRRAHQDRGHAGAQILRPRRQKQSAQPDGQRLNSHDRSFQTPLFFPPCKSGF